MEVGRKILKWILEMCKDVDWNELAQRQAFMNTVMNLQVP